MRVYLDASVVSRLLYKGKLKRFLVQRDAATILVGMIRLGILDFVASEWQILELSGGREEVARQRVSAVPPYADMVELDDEIMSRAAEISSRSMSLADAMHTAAAEFGEAEVVLTFDDKYVCGAKTSGKLSTVVVNALNESKMPTKPDKVVLPKFTIRKGETEETARRRWLRSLNLEQMKEFVRLDLPKAKRMLAQAQKAQRKRQKAS